MNQPSISIIGCGWLGLPLAEKLIDLGYSVKGSTTSHDKLDLLSSKQIEPYLIKVSEEDMNQNQAFFESDVLYINIPPGRRRANVNELYPKEIGLIVNAANRGNIKRILFISSTGVYPNNDQLVTEKAPTTGSSFGSAKALTSAESIIENCDLEWTIIRMAGLAGPNREPGRWFAGKKDIPNGLAPVNMIHLEDAVGLSIKVIEDLQSAGQIYNACADMHPTKIAFYRAQAAKLSLEIPEFIAELKEHKIISNDKIKNALSYQFSYSDPLLF